jgi:surface-anchored protein
MKVQIETPRKKKLPGLLGLLGIAGTLCAQDVVLPQGHYDLAFNYTLQEGWSSFVWDFSTSAALDPYRTVMHAHEVAEAQVPAHSDFAFLGPAGSTVWILPQIEKSGLPWLGLGAPLLEPGIFTGGLSNRGRVTLRLLDVQGSGVSNGGEFFMYQSGFPPVVYFSYEDGEVVREELSNISANFHAHYNWAFTQPGMYRVTFSLSGTLTEAAGGGYTETIVVFSFLVGPDAEGWALRYAWDVDADWQWSSWMGWVHTLQQPWVYSPLLQWVYFHTGNPDSFWLWREDLGWCWSTQHYYPWLFQKDTGEWVNF